MGNELNVSAMIAITASTMILFISVALLRRFIIIRKKAGILTETGFICSTGKGPKRISDIETRDMIDSDCIKHINNFFSGALFSKSLTTAAENNAAIPSTKTIRDQLSYCRDYLYFGPCYKEWLIEAMRSHSSKSGNWKLSSSEIINRTSTAELSPDWSARRQRVLRRDNCFCALCGSKLKGNAEVHHIVPRATGGTHDYTNLATLCKQCHGTLEHHESVFHPGFLVDDRKRVVHTKICRYAGRNTRESKEAPKGYRLCPKCKPLRSTKNYRLKASEASRSRQYPRIYRHLNKWHKPSKSLRQQAMVTMPEITMYRLKEKQWRNRINEVSLETI